MDAQTIERTHAAAKGAGWALDPAKRDRLNARALDYVLESMSEKDLADTGILFAQEMYEAGIPELAALAPHVMASNWLRQVIEQSYQLGKEEATEE